MSNPLGLASEDLRSSDGTHLLPTPGQSRPNTAPGPYQFAQPNGFQHSGNNAFASGSTMFAPPMNQPFISQHGHLPLPPPHIFPAGAMPMPVAGPSHYPQMMPQGLQNANFALPPGFRHHGGWQGIPEWDDENAGQDGTYTPTEVKHRRRTTPDQLKILEHWFNINPKPDNAMREWLAAELGMTKRNVQVWFQNRRAKIKSLALKEQSLQEKSSSESESLKSGPPPPLQTPPDSATNPSIEKKVEFPTLTQENHSYGHPVANPLMSPVDHVHMPRRESMPNGMPMSNGPQKVSIGPRSVSATQVPMPPHQSPIRSPTSIRQASFARRGSVPYPSPIPENGPPGDSSSGQMISPNVRPSTSALHLAAMRNNNTRRASVPGFGAGQQAQLISSGPFTPPRMLNAGPGPGTNVRTQSTPTLPAEGDKDSSDANGPFFFSGSDLSTTYLTPPSSTYLPTTSPNSIAPGSSGGMTFGFDASSQAPFTPNGPVPNPTYSFGSVMSTSEPGSIFPGNSDPNTFNPMMFQMRERMGSMASIATLTTDGTAGNDSETDWNDDWLATTAAAVNSNHLAPQDQAFHPGDRRSSAPAEMFQQMGLQPVTTNPQINSSNPAEVKSSAPTAFNHTAPPPPSSVPTSGYITITQTQQRPISQGNMSMMSHSSYSSEHVSPTDKA